MVEKQAIKPAISPLYRPTGLRRIVYWCGRILQIVGLLLICGVLLLFVDAVGMGALLAWGSVAVVVFYTGWACTMWARKGR
jgi:hypothetical protein